jgi:hypothetical protein
MFSVKKCMYLNNWGGVVGGWGGGGVMCKLLCSCNPVFSHKKFEYRDFAQDHDSFP